MTLDPAAAGAAAFDRDPAMRELRERLEERWALIPAGEAPSLELISSFFRAAYGRGYCQALEARVP